MDVGAHFSYIIGTLRSTLIPNPDRAAVLVQHLATRVLGPRAGSDSGEAGCDPSFTLLIVYRAAVSEDGNAVLREDLGWRKLLLSGTLSAVRARARPPLARHGSHVEQQVYGLLHVAPVWQLEITAL